MTQSADGGASAPLGEPEAIASPGAGRTLLLVDDDAPLRRSMARALERRGFQVLAAEGLAEARDHAQAHKPEFAVLDMRLTEGSGLDLVRTLRELRPEVRIVIVTGYGNIATAVAAIKAGAVDYLAKPVDADDVVDALLRSGQGLPPPPRQPDVGRSGALGAHPAGVRAVQPERVGDRAPAQHAPPHPAANPEQARAPRVIPPRLPSPRERTMHASTSGLPSALVGEGRGGGQPRPARVSNMSRQARPELAPPAADRPIASACAVRTLPGET